MNPGEYLIDDDDLKLNEGRRSFGMMVSNTGDRPIQVGSHFHFYETNRALTFDREATRGFHLDIPAGTAVRFEPGQEREIQLVEFAGTRQIFGFNAKVMGQLEDTE